MAGFHDPPWALPLAPIHGRTMSAIRSGGGGWDPTGAAPSPPGHLQDSYDSSRLASKILPTSTSMGHSATTSLHADAHAFPVAVLVVVLTWWILLACTPTSLSPYESRPPSLPSFESGFPKHRRDYALSEYTSTHSGCAVSSYSPRTYSPARGLPESRVDSFGTLFSTATSRTSSIPSLESGSPARRLDYALPEYSSTHSGCAVSPYSTRTYSPACGTNGSFEGSCEIREGPTATFTSSSPDAYYTLRQLPRCGCAVPSGVGPGCAAALGLLVVFGCACSHVVRVVLEGSSVLQVFPPGTGAVVGFLSSLRRQSFVSSMCSLRGGIQAGLV